MALWNLFASFFRSPSKEERRAYRHSAKKEEPVRVDTLLKKVESELKWSVDLSAVPTVAPRLRLELDGSFKPFLFEDGLFVVHGSVIKRFDFDGQPTGELAAPVAGAKPVHAIDPDRLVMHADPQWFVWTLSSNRWDRVDPAWEKLVAIGWVGEKLVGFSHEDRSERSENYDSYEITWLINPTSWKLRRAPDPSLGGKLKASITNYFGDLHTDYRRSSLSRIEYRALSLLGERESNPNEPGGDGATFSQGESIARPPFHWSAYPEHHEPKKDAFSVLGRQGALCGTRPGVFLYWYNPGLVPIRCADCDRTVPLTRQACACGASLPEGSARPGPRFSGQLEAQPDFWQRWHGAARLDGLISPGRLTVSDDEGVILSAEFIQERSLPNEVILAQSQARLYLVWASSLTDGGRLAEYRLDPESLARPPQFYQLFNRLERTVQGGPAEFPCDLRGLVLEGNHLCLDTMAGPQRLRIEPEGLVLEANTPSVADH
ncbi:MAG: hypothetical protein AB7S38_31505 [Vulcanimicrobiota bacterium]